MRKIYIFWIGDSNKISPLIDKLKKQGFDVEVGPSKSDHEFLYKEYTYYSKSFDMGIYSFCSDVWRFWKLAKNKGMYIDTSVVIGPKFSEFYDKAMMQPTFLFKEGANYIGSAIIGSSVNNNELFTELDSFYKTLKENPRIYAVAPYFLTYFSYKKWKISKKYLGWSNEEVYVAALLEVRNEETIKKMGSGSWLPKNAGDGTTANDTWRLLEELWRNKKSIFYMKKPVKDIFKFGPGSINFYWFLKAYDASSKSSRNELMKLYNSSVNKYNKFSVRKQLKEIKKLN